MILTVLVILLLNNKFVKGNNDNKYIDLLPEEEKQEFLNKIARRILDEIQSKGKGENSAQLSDDQLNVHNDYVQKLLKEETDNIKIGRRNTNRSDTDNIARDGDIVLQENKESDSSPIKYIDLTLRQGVNDKSGKEFAPKDILESTTETNHIPVEIIYDELNQATTVKQLLNKINENNSEHDIQVKDFPKRKAMRQLVPTIDNQFGKTQMIDFDPPHLESNSDHELDNTTSSTRRIVPGFIATTERVDMTTENKFMFTQNIDYVSELDKEYGSNEETTSTTEISKSLYISKPENQTKNDDSKMVKYLRSNKNIIDETKINANKSEIFDKINYSDKKMESNDYKLNNINNKDNFNESKSTLPSVMMPVTEQSLDISSTHLIDMINMEKTTYSTSTYKKEMIRNEEVTGNKLLNGSVTENTSGIKTNVVDIPKPESQTKSDGHKMVKYLRSDENIIDENKINANKSEMFHTINYNDTKMELNDYKLNNIENFNEAKSILPSIIMPVTEPSSSTYLIDIINMENTTYSTSTYKKEMIKNKEVTTDKMLTGSVIENTSGIKTNVIKILTPVDKTSTVPDNGTSIHTQVVNSTPSYIHIKSNYSNKVGDRIENDKEIIGKSNVEQRTADFIIVHNTVVENNVTITKESLYRLQDREKTKDLQPNFKNTLRGGYEKKSNSTKVSNINHDSSESTAVKSDVNHYNVFEVSPEEKPFVITSHKKQQEQPYYVPIYNYASNNAYFNAHNRLGPNSEDSSDENGNYGKDRTNRRIEMKGFDIDYYFDRPPKLRTSNNTKQILENYRKRFSSKHSKHRKHAKKSHEIYLPIANSRPKESEIYFNNDDYFDMEYYFGRSSNKKQRTIDDSDSDGYFFRASDTDSTDFEDVDDTRSFDYTDYGSQEFSIPYSNEDMHPIQTKGKNKTGYRDYIRQVLYANKHFGYVQSLSEKYKDEETSTAKTTEISLRNRDEQYDPKYSKFHFRSRPIYTRDVAMDYIIGREGKNTNDGPNQKQANDETTTGDGSDVTDTTIDITTTGETTAETTEESTSTTTTTAATTTKMNHKSYQAFWDRPFPNNLTEVIYNQKDAAKRIFHRISKWTKYGLLMSEGMVNVTRPEIVSINRYLQMIVRNNASLAREFGLRKIRNILSDLAQNFTAIFSNETYIYEYYSKWYSMTTQPTTTTTTTTTTTPTTPSLENNQTTGDDNATTTEDSLTGAPGGDGDAGGSGALGGEGGGGGDEGGGGDGGAGHGNIKSRVRVRAKEDVDTNADRMRMRSILHYMGYLRMNSNDTLESNPRFGENITEEPEIDKDVKRADEDELDVYSKVLSDMIERDSKALKQYDWLGTTVDVQSALQKLNGLIEDVSNGVYIHPSDLEILQYTTYLHSLAENIVKEEIGKTKRITTTEVIESKRNMKKEMARLRLPKNKRKKKGEKIKNPLALLDQARNQLRATTPRPIFEEDYESLRNLLRSLLNGLYDLHNAIKHIAIVTNYKNQRWYENLKELYLKEPDNDKILQVLLHIITNRLLELIEESSQRGVEDDFVDYITKNAKEVNRTLEEFVFVHKMCDKIKISNS